VKLPDPVILADPQSTSGTVGDRRVGAPAGPTRVIAIAAYTAAFEGYDYSMASAIAMIMGAVQLIIVVAVLALRSAFYRGPAGGAKG
jgi:putative spermidine/putrescine transport system permease protein